MGLFTPSATAKRVLRVVHVEPGASAELIDAVGDASTTDDVVARLTGFYRARAVALELRRHASVVGASEWADLQHRIALLGVPGLLADPAPALTRRERDELVRLMDVLALAQDKGELAESLRSQIADLRDLAQLRARDPEGAARATVEAVLDPDRLSLESIAEAALEVCTGPDPIALDLPLPFGAPPVYATGYELIRPDDGCSCVEAAYLVLHDDLLELARGCGEIEERMDPELASARPAFVANLERLGQAARSIHARRDMGLLVAQVLDMWK